MVDGAPAEVVVICGDSQRGARGQGEARHQPQGARSAAAVINEAGAEDTARCLGERGSLLVPPRRV